MNDTKITVPKDESIINALANLGTLTESSWIFLHRRVVTQAVNSKEFEGQWLKNGLYQLTRNSSIVEKIIVNYGFTPDWKMVTLIDSDNVAFKKPASDPKHIIRLIAS